MGKIKVTGYIDTDNLPSEFVDLSNPDGLTSEGFDAIMGVAPVAGLEHEGNLKLDNLDDVEFELEP